MRAGAIFDMDGLLFDTELVYNQEWDYIAELYGLKVDPAMLDELRGTNGTRMSEIVNTYWPRVDAKKLTDELFAHAIVTLSKQVPMKPGVVELLEYLKQHAVRMAVASSAPMELIKSNLRLAGIADYFDAVVSGEQVEHGKPFPDIFLLAAQKLNLQAQDCYVFEDGINGVRAGIQAGCSTIMVPDLVPPTKELYEQCTGIYPSLHAVLHALQTYTC